MLRIFCIVVGIVFILPQVRVSQSVVRGDLACGPSDPQAVSEEKAS
jgi:hypothetical protein